MEKYDSLIILADDHKMFAEGLIALLQKEMSGYRFTHVLRGDHLISLLNRIHPRLVLLDINMPGINGIEALEIIKKKNNDIKVIMLSTHSDTNTIKICQINGADAFLLKNVGIDELVHTITQVLQQSYRAKNKFELNDDKKFTWINMHFKITPREWEIIQLIKIGETNMRISQLLKLSIYTIETHRKNLMLKLKLKSPAELTRFIIENNL